MVAKLMIYGAYGYTGRLIAAQAIAQGHEVILSGRDPEKLGKVAKDLSAPQVAFELTDGPAMRAALGAVGIVINAAGPFTHTSKPMLDACLDTGTHYLDITGEVGVLAACAARSDEAKAAGITVMPGCGFDVVPTDCMAAMLAKQMPDATRLRLGFSGLVQASRGTMRTAAMFVADPVLERRNGRIVPREGPLDAMVDFGKEPERVYALSWGDIETAAHTTGIGNIEVFSVPPNGAEILYRIPGFFRSFLGTRLGNKLMLALVARAPEGPDQAQRQQGYGIVVGTVWNDAGESLTLRLRTADGYHLTALTSVEIARRVMSGHVATGFQTPAGAFGSDFILTFEGSGMID